MTTSTCQKPTPLRRSGKTNALPDGFAPCRLCQGQGDGSYTLLKELKAWEGDGIRMTLVHWCDKGHALSGGEIFKRRTAHGLGDISLQAPQNGNLDDLRTLWKTLNS